MFTYLSRREGWNRYTMITPKGFVLLGSMRMITPKGFVLLGSMRMITPKGFVLLGSKSGGMRAGRTQSTQKQTNLQGLLLGPLAHGTYYIELSC